MMVTQSDCQLEAAVRGDAAPHEQVTWGGGGNIAIRPEIAGVYREGTIDTTQCMRLAKIEQDETGVMVYVALMTVPCPGGIPPGQRLHVAHGGTGRSFNVPGTGKGRPRSLHFREADGLGGSGVGLNGKRLRGIPQPHIPCSRVDKEQERERHEDDDPRQW